jgi:hypothetical protein
MRAQAGRIDFVRGLWIQAIALENRWIGQLPILACFVDRASPVRVSPPGGALRAAAPTATSHRHARGCIAGLDLTMLGSAPLAANTEQDGRSSVSSPSHWHFMRELAWPRSGRQRTKYENSCFLGY